jgi:uncharacterized membrane protein
MSSSILIVAFEEERMAEKALDTLDEMHLDKLFKIADAVVIKKDFQGDVKVWEKGELTTKKGAISGGIAGLVIGTLVGGPIGGALLGAAAGAIAGKATDLGIPNEKIDEISDHMERASSTLILVLKSGDPEKIAASLEKTGGKTIEVTISDEVQEEMEKRLSNSGAA